MRCFILTGLLAFQSLLAATPVSVSPVASLQVSANNILATVSSQAKVIAPKVFIISMFDAEGQIWYENAQTPGSIGDLLAYNITVPGLSPLFPQVHCLASTAVCQLTTGESEINAATTLTALVFSPLFDLSKTYFMIAGIGGINPKQGTLADVTFARYAVQVALQYEFDSREIPADYSTGYIPQGATRPNQYPGLLYGTEVFELNAALRDVAMGFARTAKLNDSEDTIAYRAKYASSLRDSATNMYISATRTPAILACDVTTADVFYSGTLLGEAFENTTSTFTNGTAQYCIAAQEDNASLEPLLRASIRKAVDFSRVIIMRTASDFDRPPPGMSGLANLFNAPAGCFIPAIENVYLAGNKVVQGILAGWDSKFAAGVKAQNYVGDIWGTLGGKPDFGPGSVYGDIGYSASHVAADGEIMRRGDGVQERGGAGWRERYVAVGGRRGKGIRGWEVARDAQRRGV